MSILSSIAWGLSAIAVASLLTFLSAAHDAYRLDREERS